MICFTEEIWTFDELYNYCWGQARKVLQEISDADNEEDLMNYLSGIYIDYAPTLTEINDYLSYDWEEIYDAIGMEENEDDDD